ncbi:MAG: hypothetical protein K0R66_1125 [Gammaproteobacteria bacterium]|jgi:hypothetical protein|nr:hypothetical protein [Gammaproteobacteria bacterium]
MLNDTALLFGNGTQPASPDDSNPSNLWWVGVVGFAAVVGAFAFLLTRKKAPVCCRYEDSADSTGTEGVELSAEYDYKPAP